MAQARLLVVAGLVWLDARCIAVARRGPGAAMGAGALELPGGKVELGEPPAAALARELTEEWGPSAALLRVGKVAEIVHHCYPPPGPEVVLCVYHVDGRAWAADGHHRHGRILAGGEQLVVCDHQQLPVDEFLAADRPLIARVVAGTELPDWALVSVHRTLAPAST